MGYRSQVVLAVGKELMPQFLVTLAKSPDTRAMCFSHADQTKKDYDGEGGMLFYWNSCKWYDDYEEVRAIEDFLDWAECEVFGEAPDNVNGDECFRFVRAGENDDDNVCRGHGFQDIYISRSIEF